MIAAKAELLRMLDGMKTDLAGLEQSHQDLHATAVQLAVLYESLSKKAEEVARIAQMGGQRSGIVPPPPPPLPGARPLAPRAQMAAGTASPSTATLVLATKEMQEMNTSFNLQYLQLQQKMQSDNRKFTVISNVMKTKHDTAKNAINNVR